MTAKMHVWHWLKRRPTRLKAELVLHKPWSSVARLRAGLISARVQQFVDPKFQGKPLVSTEDHEQAVAGVQAHSATRKATALQKARSATSAMRWDILHEPVETEEGSHHPRTEMKEGNGTARKSKTSTRRRVVRKQSNRCHT